MVGSTTSRAAEVLDRLVQEQQRRPLFRRELSGSDPDPDLAHAHGATEHMAETSTRRNRSPRIPLGALVVLAVLLVAGVAILGRGHLGRPAPLDERLPIASDESRGSAGAPTTTNESGVVADPSVVAATGAAASTGATASQPVFVHVAGAVASPGVVQLPGGSRVVDAVSAAGGLRPDADPERVNLAAPLLDGSRIVVPAVGQPLPNEMATVPPPGDAAVPGAGGGAAGGAATTSAPLDLNTATLDQLDELPGVGPSTAQAILDHRQSNGRFTSVDSLLDVRGIGDAKLEAIRDLVSAS